MQSAILNEINDKGIDVLEGLERLDNDEELYLILLEGIFEDEDYINLSENILNGNVQKAFSNAHALKGMLQNMGFNEAGKPLMELTEILRAGKMDGVSELYERFTNYCDEIKAIIEKGE